jgi:chemotaxis protein methyltransferase CheR
MPSRVSPRVSPRVIELLSALVEERTGISYEARDHEIFADKLLARAGEVGFESALDYYYFLRYDTASAAEFEALVEALVVTETYFFREAAPLRAVVDQFLVPAARRGERPRVWSAACASGDEPLTLAMMLDEAGVLPLTDIVASDLSLRAHRLARERGFGPRSLRGLPVEARRWMRIEGDRGHVDRRLFEAVDWRQVNLTEPAQIATLGTFDVVVCRNVLIYFSDETIQRVVRMLAEQLRPEGRLLVGASESLLRFGTFLECEERGGVFLYRKSASP